MNERPKVGVGVIVMKDNKVILGKRINKHGHKTWCFAGGHLEFGESWEECAHRETMEEIGITIKNVRFSNVVTNDFFSLENKHYITIYMLADYDSGQVNVLEPEKCEAWEWFEWDALPEPLFLPIQNLLKQEYSPFEKVPALI